MAAMAMERPGLLDSARLLDPEAYRPGPFPARRSETMEAFPPAQPPFEVPSGSLGESLAAFLAWAAEITGSRAVWMIDGFENCLDRRGPVPPEAQRIACRLAERLEQTLRMESDLADWERPLHSGLPDGRLIAVLPCRFRGALFGLALLLERPLSDGMVHALRRGWRECLTCRV